MAPVEFLDAIHTLVVIERILAVGDPEVGILYESLQRSGNGVIAIGFVVGGEAEYPPVELDAIAEGFLWVMELACFDRDWAIFRIDRDCPAIMDRVEFHFHASVLQFSKQNWEHRMVHLSLENRFQIGIPFLTAIEGELVLEHSLWHVEWSKERQALDVVPVDVALEDDS